ncbi:MAG: hypothetical protein RIR00_816 [Pseudomonadota bacterium]|jgi:DNA-binding transcriptional regulator YiaG
MNLHPYPGALLRNIWLQDGYLEHSTPFGQGVSYTDVEGLFRAIALALCLSPHQLDGDAVRFLRKRLDLTQEALGIEMGCSGQAVAKWEKGEVAMIPVAAARLLRLLVLARLTPDSPLNQALAGYREPPPAMMIFSHTPTQGWRCIEQRPAADCDPPRQRIAG